MRRQWWRWPLLFVGGLCVAVGFIAIVELLSGWLILQI